VEFIEEERSIIQAHRDATRNVTVIGQVVGRSPPFRDLNAWARETLHSSLESIVLLGNVYFEATFSTKVGSTHVFDGKYLMGASPLILAQWSPLFFPEQEAFAAALRYPIWVQIQGFGKHLQNEAYLPILALKLGQVLKVKTLESYRAKIARYQIKILRGSIHDLPTSTIIPGEKIEEFTKHGLLFSGLPDQC